MSFRAYRDAIVADIRAHLVLTRTETARPFLDAQSAPARIDEVWLKHVSVKLPSVHIAFVGSKRRIDRIATGQMIGSWTTVAHVVAGGGRQVGLQSETAMLDKLYELAVWIEGRNFGYPGAGPAMVTEIENLWDINTDRDGISLGSLMITQDVVFGRDLAAEEFALGGPMFDLLAPAGGLPPMHELHVEETVFGS